jgi:hypothetical protein
VDVTLVAFVKESDTVANSATLILVILVPSPENPDAVIAFVTFNEDRLAEDPLVITFFQFGILLLLWLVTLSSPLPIKAYNSFVYK